MGAITPYVVIRLQRCTTNVNSSDNLAALRWGFKGSEMCRLCAGGRHSLFTLALMPSGWPLVHFRVVSSLIYRLCHPLHPEHHSTPLWNAVVCCVLRASAVFSLAGGGGGRRRFSSCEPPSCASAFRRRGRGEKPWPGSLLT